MWTLWKVLKANWKSEKMPKKGFIELFRALKSFLLWNFRCVKKFKWVMKVRFTLIRKGWLRFREWMTMEKLGSKIRSRGSRVMNGKVKKAKWEKCRKSWRLFWFGDESWKSILEKSFTSSETILQSSKPQNFNCEIFWKPGNFEWKICYEYFCLKNIFPYV